MCINKKFYFQLAFLFLFLVSIKWSFIGVAGSDIPFHDQWDVEGELLYPKWQSGTLTIQDLFKPCNEHRIVFTNLLNLSLIAINKQWDPIIQMMVGAIIHSLAAVVLMLWIGKSCNNGERTALTVLIGVLFLPYLSWQNTLWGNQSQVYFVLFFSLLALFWVNTCAVFSLYWWLGVCAALAAMFSMAPGALTPASILAFVIFRVVETRKFSSIRWPLVAIAVALIGLYLVARPSAPVVQGFNAKSFQQFTEALTICLGWPNLSVFWFIPTNAPLIYLIYLRLTRRITADLIGDNAILLGFWAIGTAVAQAWMRGALPGVVEAGPPSRYVDFLVLLSVSNGLALLNLLRLYAGLSHRAIKIAASAWCFILIAGWIELSNRTMEFAVLPRIRNHYTFSWLTKAFQISGDPGIFEQASGRFKVHPDLSVLTRVLHNQEIALLLPPSLQTPIDLVWPNSNNGFLLEHGSPDNFPQTGYFKAWSTFGENSHHRTGSIISCPFKIDSSAVELSVLATTCIEFGELAFVDESTGRTQLIDWTDLPVDKWENTVLKIRPGTYRLKVESRAENGWLAFTAPRKLGILSYYGRIILNYRGPFLWLSSGLFVVFLFGLGSSDSPIKQPSDR